MLTEIKEYKMPEYTLRDKYQTMAPLCTQYAMLFWRIKTFTVREPASIFARVGNEIFGGLLMLGLFY